MGFPFSKLKQEDLAFFLGIVGEKGCSISPEILDTYSHDWTHKLDQTIRLAIEGPNAIVENMKAVEVRIVNNKECRSLK